MLLKGYKEQGMEHIGGLIKYSYVISLRNIKVRRDEEAREYLNPVMSDRMGTTFPLNGPRCDFHYFICLRNLGQCHPDCLKDLPLYGIPIHISNL